MQQRIVSLFGIAQEAEQIIADEPTKGLDSFLREQIYNFFLELKKRKTSLIIITHDINLAVKLSDYIIVMNNGQIVEEGETKLYLKILCTILQKFYLIAYLLEDYNIINM